MVFPLKVKNHATMYKTCSQRQKKYHLVCSLIYFALMDKKLQSLNAKFPMIKLAFQDKI